MGTERERAHSNRDTTKRFPTLVQMFFALVILAATEASPAQMKSTLDTAEKFFNDFDSSDEYSSFDESEMNSDYSSNSSRGVKPRLEEDSPIEGSAPLTVKMCETCRRFGGACYDPDTDSSSKLVDDEDLTPVCSCDWMDCDPNFFDKSSRMMEEVCDDEDVRYESLCMLKLTRCSEKRDIRVAKCGMKAAKTPVVTYQKYQERKNADEPTEVDQGLSKSTHPLDFYGADYQEIPEPTSFPADYNFGTSDGSTMVDTTEAMTTTTRFINDGTSEAAVVIAIVEVLVFICLVAVLVYSYIRARALNQHRPLGSVESATIQDPILVPTKIVQ